MNEKFSIKALLEAYGFRRVGRVAKAIAERGKGWAIVAPSPRGQGAQLWFVAEDSIATNLPEIAEAFGEAGGGWVGCLPTGERPLPSFLALNIEELVR